MCEVSTRKKPAEREDAGQLIGSAPGMYYEKVYSNNFLASFLDFSFVPFDASSIWYINEESVIRR